MKILALDPAKLCGWAWQDTDDPQSIRFGVWDIGRAGTLGAQHDALSRALSKLFDVGVEMIAAENAGFGSRNPSVQAMHNERLGALRMLAWQHGISVETFSPSTIKSFATGSGNADKRQMVAAAARLLGLRNLTEDEADAVWILELAKRPDCWPKKEPKVRKPRAVRAPKKAKRLF